MRLIRTLLTLAALAAVLVWVAGSLLLEREPAVARLAPPTPQDVQATRAMVHKVRRATESADPEEDTVSLPLGTLRGALRMSARAMPDLRADAEITEGAVVGTASVPVPWLTGKRWLNVSATMPAFAGAPELSQVTVGGRELPPGAALWIGRIGANLVLGNRIGDRILSGVSALAIRGDEIDVTLRLSREGRGQVMSGVIGAIRDSEMPPPEEIDRYYTLIRSAMDDGTLPAGGSFLPYILFILNAARAASADESLPNAYTAALFALTRVCGARDFAVVVGRLATATPATEKRWKVSCTRLTLAGRIDTRLHFTTAAAIKAAGNRGLAISIGEFKEMSDSLRGGSKFDFTDIVADNAGIRLSDRFMAAPAAEWPGLIARITSESDLLPSLEGLPPPMPEDAFQATFGDVNSPAYAAVMAEIEGRIDRTALHAPGG